VGRDALGLQRCAEDRGGVGMGFQGGEHDTITIVRVPAVLITVEGIDGAGKSTLVAGLADALRERDPVVLREPGGVELSERLRSLVKDPSLTVGARAEALLYAAARAQLVAEQLRPLLESGTTVLLDRFVDSSLAYQGGGRGLGVEAVRELNAFATAGLTPDRTLLLRLDPETGLARVGGRLEGFDRLEREQLGFWRAIAEAYEALAAAEPERWIVIDAAQPPERVLSDTLAQLAPLLEP
jgi:dTMP kinase